mmetsp:Transcript_6917/g.7519  ORF Transcript_6917/g.7519 Transcript_6917/m.7519 type:complete len:217 (-) Transcript_6917:52-702(-)
MTAPRWLHIWVQSALVPLVAALRRGPPAEMTKIKPMSGYRIMNDYQDLMSFYSSTDIEEVTDSLKRVKVVLLRSIYNLTLPTHEALSQWTPRTCAIVASGWSVLNAEAGRHIDEVPGPIVRMNQAVTTGYERFVGRRTDAMFVNEQFPCFWKNYSLGPPAQAKWVFINPVDKLIPYECMKYLQDRFPRVHFFLLDYPLVSPPSRHQSVAILAQGNP